MSKEIMATSGQSAGLARHAHSVSSPIGLLAFVGAVIEVIIAVLAVRVGGGDFTSGVAIALIAAAILLPIILIGAIYRLISRFPENLYTPGQYGSPELFVSIFERQRKMASIDKSHGIEHQEPFILSNATSSEQLAIIESRAAHWEPVLRSMGATEFRLLHNWFNEHNLHDLAALCLDIAIAKGEMSSSNYSFRSASLRKLGRFRDAIYSARLALDLDAANLDAEYNLSKALLGIGMRKEALMHARIAAREGVFLLRLLPLFPELDETGVDLVGEDRSAQEPSRDLT
jgi:hypothetical protein